jgi:hypothetical protein
MRHVLSQTTQSGTLCGNSPDGGDITGSLEDTTCADCRKIGATLKQRAARSEPLAEKQKKAMRLGEAKAAKVQLWP